jgi:hypothetical protein
MSRTHAILISLLLGVAVVLGAFAAVRTTTVSAEPSSASAESIAVRQQRLDNVEAQLRRSLARRPPALPATSSASVGVAPRVTYVRAPSTVSSAASAEHDAYGEDEGHEEGYEEESDD